MRFLAWFAAFFMKTPATPYRSILETPYRSPFVPPVEPVSKPKPSNKIRKLINFQKWIDPIKDLFNRMIPMFKYIACVATCFASIIGMGALYDLNNPTLMGLRVTVGICCGIMCIICGCLFLHFMEHKNSR